MLLHFDVIELTRHRYLTPTSLPRNVIAGLMHFLIHVHIDWVVLLVTGAASAISSSDCTIMIHDDMR